MSNDIVGSAGASLSRIGSPPPQDFALTRLASRKLGSVIPQLRDLAPDLDLDSARLCGEQGQVTENDLAVEKRDCKRGGDILENRNGANLECQMR